MAEQIRDSPPVGGPDRPARHVPDRGAGRADSSPAAVGGDGCRSGAVGSLGPLDVLKACGWVLLWLISAPLAAWLWLGEGRVRWKAGFLVLMFLATWCACWAVDEAQKQRKAVEIAWPVFPATGLESVEWEPPPAGQRDGQRDGKPVFYSSTPLDIDTVDRLEGNGYRVVSPGQNRAEYRALMKALMRLAEIEHNLRRRK